MRHASSLVISAFACLIVVCVINADEREAIESMLKSQVITPELSQAEVEAFCEARVPLVPPTTSKMIWEQTTDKWRADMFEQVIFRAQRQSGEQQLAGWIGSMRSKVGRSIASRN